MKLCEILWESSLSILLDKEILILSFLSVETSKMHFFSSKNSLILDFFFEFILRGLKFITLFLQTEKI